METWQYWVISGIVLFAAEIFTPGFVLMSIGAACLLAGLSAWLGFSTGVQAVVFAVGTVAAFLATRPFVKKFLYNKENLPTGTNALTGKKAKVNETINNDDNCGRVQVGGDSWKARSSDGSVIEEGNMVEIIGVEGVTLTVKKL
jgi:membrane protein implicated in regulation of membrane protease activity